MGLHPMKHLTRFIFLLGKLDLINDHSMDEMTQREMHMLCEKAVLKLKYQALPDA